MTPPEREGWRERWTLLACAAGIEACATDADRRKWGEKVLRMMSDAEKQVPIESSILMAEFYTKDGFYFPGSMEALGPGRYRLIKLPHETPDE